MTIDQEIFERAKVIYRDELTAAAESALLEMCLAAYAELQKRLRQDVDEAEIHEQFVRAAAVLGISLFIGLDCPGIDSFSAGNVTLKKRGAGSMRDAASSMRNQAELMLAGYLKDGAFCFGAVKA